MKAKRSPYETVFAAMLLACAWVMMAVSVPPAGAQSKAAPKAAKSAKSGLNLLNPATIKGKPPEVFIVKLETTKGDITMRIVRAWSPNGVERFYNLVRAGFYDNTYFFRVLDFMAQFGISSDPKISAVWSDKNIFDDRPVQGNNRGMVSFAAGGQPNTRSTQIFINKKNNQYLNDLKFAPIGEVIQGMEVVDAIYGGYREDPDQGDLEAQGEPYLNRFYPRLDKINKASIIAVPGK